MMNYCQAFLCIPLGANMTNCMVKLDLKNEADTQQGAACPTLPPFWRVVAFFLGCLHLFFLRFETPRFVARLGGEASPLPTGARESERNCVVGIGPAGTEFSQLWLKGECPLVDIPSLPRRRQRQKMRWRKVDCCWHIQSSFGGLQTFVYFHA